MLRTADQDDPAAVDALTAVCYAAIQASRQVPNVDFWQKL